MNVVIHKTTYSNSLLYPVGVLNYTYLKVNNKYRKNNFNISFTFLLMEL